MSLSVQRTQRCRPTVSVSTVWSGRSARRLRSGGPSIWLREKHELLQSDEIDDDLLYKKAACSFCR